MERRAAALPCALKACVYISPMPAMIDENSLASARARAATQFLASVSSLEEARAALAGGADLIDAKDPRLGALGALAPGAVAEIVKAMAGLAPVSAVAGDLPMRPEPILAAAEALAATGVDYVKVGLFADPGREACIAALAPLARRIKLIGVMFADAGADVALLPAMASAGFAGAMLDTAGKDGKRLLDFLGAPELLGFVEACRENGLLAGLAGSLELPDIPRLLPLGPDFLGFRAALCGAAGRRSAIDPAALRAVRDLIPRERAPTPAPAKVDFRVLAAQGFSNDAKRGAGATDRIFVRDFVLPVRIGAYASERGHPQRVRFNVDVDLRRLDHVSESLADVLSYDVITDGIAMIVANEHIGLAETLAERVAALALAHPRVARVNVRVEKLDIRPGSVGVEITRERAEEAGGVHRLFPGLEGRPQPKRAS